MQAKYDARNPAALKQLVAGGTKLFRFPKDVMDAAFKAAMALYSELSRPATRPGRRSTTTTPPSAATQNLWFRFTEAGFDDFMQAQKL